MAAAARRRVEVVDERPELLASLRVNLGEYDDYRGRIGPLLRAVWRDATRWCDVSVAMSRHPSVHTASKSLAQLLGRTHTSVYDWVKHGTFVRINGLDDVDHSVTRELCSGWRRLSRAQQLKAVDLAKKREPADALAAIRRVKRRATGAAERAAIQREKKIRKDGDWTEKRMQLELMAFATLMARFFGSEVSVEVRDGDGAQLAETSAAAPVEG